MSSDCKRIRDPDEYRIPDHRYLREARICLGLTQLEVAERVGVDRDTIRRWEKGVNSPQISDVQDLLNVFREERGRDE